MDDVIDLDVAIELQISLGERDPLVLTRKLFAEYGEQWAREEAAARAEEYIIILARQAVGNARRRAEKNLVSGNAGSELVLRQSRVWIPNGGWKILDDCSAADLLARAEWYHAFITAARKRELWCRQVAQLIIDEGVERLGEVTQPLPPLPYDEDPDEIAA